MLLKIGKFCCGLLLVLLHVLAFALPVVVLDLIGVDPDNLLIVFFGLILLELWTVCAYFRYRAGRQAEVLQLIRSAIASNVPLEPALRTYVSERSSRLPSYVLQGSLVLLITPLVPFALALWLWIFLRRFDRLVGQFADKLYEGMPLTDALADVPSVLSAEARLVIRVGMATGKLDRVFERADREPTVLVWLEVVPRLIYPLFVLFAVLGLSTYAYYVLVSKFPTLFDQMGIPLPRVTQAVVDHRFWLRTFAAFVGTAFLMAIVLAVALAYSSRLRWHFPLFGHYYRRDLQGRVMRMLGLLLEAEVPAPEAVSFLAASREMPDVVRRRLASAALALGTGEPLSGVLAARSLIPPGQRPMIDSSQAVGTLAWTLRELGEQTSNAAVRALRRLAAVIAPVAIVLVGIGVTVSALGIFLPILRLIEGCT